MKSKPPRSATSEWTSARRELARRDQELFGFGGRSHPGAVRADQYLHLWDRILLQLGVALACEPCDDEIEVLEALSRELAEAQAQNKLPPPLVRRILANADSHAPTQS